MIDWFIDLLTDWLISRNICKWGHSTVSLKGILNPLSWADWLIRFWLVESGHVTTKRISRLMRVTDGIYKLARAKSRNAIHVCIRPMWTVLCDIIFCNVCRVTIAAFLSLWYLYFFAIYCTFTCFELFTTLAKIWIRQGQISRVCVGL